jgi:hypothetical protein
MREGKALVSSATAGAGGNLSPILISARADDSRHAPPLLCRGLRHIPQAFTPARTENDYSVIFGRARDSPIPQLFQSATPYI